MRDLPTTRSPRGSSADAGSRLRLPFAHVAKTAAGLGAFALVLRSIDVSEVGSQLRKSGAPAALVLLPPCLGLVLHSLAWKSLFRRGAAPRGLARLTLLHVAAEGIRLALPGGSTLGEVAAARGAHALGASWRDSIASLVGKRGCLIATNGVWLMTLAIIAMLCGFRSGADVSPGFAMLGPQFAAVAALGLLCAGALVIHMLR